MLTGISLVVPAVLSTIFYILAKTSPGGIQPGTADPRRDRRKKNNHVCEVHQTPSVPTETIEEQEAVPEEELAEETVPEEQVVEEVPEEVEVPVVVEKKKKKKNKTVEPEEPPQEVVEVVEDVPEPVVEEPEPVVAPVEKKKKKKNKASQPEQPPAEVVEETVVPDETALVADEEENQEEPVQAEVAETEAVVTEEPVAEEAEEVADAIEETSPEKGKKKKKKKPKASALLAEQFRLGTDAVAAHDEFEQLPPDDGEWLAITKKERKEAKAAVEEATAEAGPTDDAAEDVEGEEVVENDVVEDDEQAAETEAAQDEALADEENKEEVEDDANEECDEDGNQEANVETEQAVEDEDEEEEEEEKDDEAQEEEEEEKETVGTIEIPYKDRRHVAQHYKLIENQTGAHSMKEIGGTCTIKGKASAIREAKTAIQCLIEKGYTLLSFENPKEVGVDVHGSKIPALIGKGGCVVKKIKEAHGVEINLPKDTDKNRRYRIYVAGEEGETDQAVTVIQEILEVGFSPLTHPGYSKEEVKLDHIEKGFVIGRGGTEIKKISETYSVKVNISDDKATILGLEGEVNGAVRYIKHLLESDEIAKKIEGLRKREQKAAEEAAAKAAAEEAARKAEQENEEETEEAAADNENTEDVEEGEEAADEDDDKEEEDEDEEEKENDEEKTSEEWTAL